VTTTASSAPAVKRSIRILEPIRQDGQGAIRITKGNVVEDYKVQTFEAYAGNATGVTLTKKDGTTYDICLSTDPSETTCSCPGATYHKKGGACKHILVLQLLARMERLPLPRPQEGEDSDLVEADCLVGC